MNKKITKNTSIYEAMEINPDAGFILAEAGIGCIGCAFAYAETLEEGLKAHGLEDEEINKIIKKLNE